MAATASKHQQKDAEIDPALKDTDKSGQESSVDRSSMPHRQMSSPFVSSPAFYDDFSLTGHDRRRQHHHFDANTNRAPSPPPPITTMPNSHSPSPSVVSVDRSSNSTPHIRRSPSNMQPPPPAPSAPAYYNHPHDNRHFGGARGDNINPYVYAPPAPSAHFEAPRYDHHPHHYPDPTYHHHPYAPHPASLAHFPVPPMQHAPYQPSSHGRQQYPLPGQAPVTIVHTDDAATKLTDGIRRRCFNCCTTDTSTWRRSNLSPGKVLCNKCGLFERTHSRPRPDQFPHKRGPLASAALRGRTPPGQQGQGTQLPPISAAAPYQYHHGQLTPLAAGGGDYSQHHNQHPQGNTLPGLQSWHGQNNSGSSTSASSSSGANVNGNTNGASSNGNTNGTSASAGGEMTGPGGQSTSTSRRSTLDSPRMGHSTSSSTNSSSGPRGSVKVFDEPLSSNAADPHAHTTSSSSHSYSSHSHKTNSHNNSHPPSPISRSSTQQLQHERYTPPPERTPPL